MQKKSFSINRISKSLARRVYLNPRTKYLYRKFLKTSSNADVTELSYTPKISIIVPMYNTPEKFFIEMIDSVFNQTYENWELILVDDASTDSNVRTLIKKYASIEPRIKYKFLSHNLHISGATNEAIRISTGEFISLFDHDDILWPEALYEVVKALNDRKYDLIYTDEDKVTEDKDKNHEPFFKTGWNQDFLYSVNYITHFTTIRKSLLNKIGYEADKYNGAQDWELFLRVARNTSKDKIHHIPKVLYSWRVHESSTAKSLSAKPYVLTAQKLAVEGDLRARGYKNFKVVLDDQYPGQWHVSFMPKVNERVSIVVSNQNLFNQIKFQVEKNTKYKNYEIISSEANLDYSDILEKASGKYIVFINEILNITDPSWIHEMLGDAQRPDVGFVLSRLKSTNEVINNISGLVNPLALPLIRKMSSRAITKHLYITTKYNIEAFSSGVFMIEASKLHKVLRNVSDTTDIVEISDKVSNHNYRNVYNPYVKMVK